MNVSALQFISSLNVDQIFGIKTGSVSISNANPTPSTIVKLENLYTADTYNTSGTVFPFFQGVYTVDNDPTVYNMSELNGAAFFNPLNIGCTTSVLISAGNIPSLRVYPFITSGSSIPDSNTHTVNYTIALFNSVSASGIVTPNITNNLQLAFSSNFNYQKVFSQDFKSFALDNTTTQSIVVPHNLGYKPFVRAFYEYVHSGTGLHWLDDACAQFYMDVRTDETNVTFVCNAVVWNRYGWTAHQDGTLHYRIYYD